MTTEGKRSVHVTARLDLAFIAGACHRLNEDPPRISDDNLLLLADAVKSLQDYITKQSTK